jgi:hypothetical protein
MAENSHANKLAVVIESEANASRRIGPEGVMSQNKGLCFAIAVDQRDLIVHGADHLTCWAIDCPVMIPTLVHTPPFTVRFSENRRNVLAVSL